MKGFEIRKCRKSEVVRVGEFYDSVVKHLDETGTNYPKWTYKVYPSLLSAAEAQRKGEQYICMRDGAICGAFVMNTDPGCAYEKGNWKSDIKRGEYIVMHALAVGHEFYHLGVGTAIVKFCQDAAVKAGLRAVRTDVVPGNSPATALYEKNGFAFAGEYDLERGIPEIPTFCLYGWDA